MTKQTIEVEGLPEGWSIDKVSICSPDYVTANKMTWIANVFLEKIQPCRIAFYEITDGTQDIDADYYIKYKWWREVKETDIPLHKEEPNEKMDQCDGEDRNLELNVKELRNVRSLIKDFENLGWFINPERALLLQKISEFIKDK